MTAQILRKRYMRELSGMDRYSKTRAWCIVAAFITQIVGAVALGAWLLSLETSALTVLGVVGVMLFIGTRLRGLNNIVHECSHATFTEQRSDNVRIGSLCASFVLGCFADYRDEHLSHHAHLGDYDRDMDLQGIEDLRLHDPLTLATVLRHAIRPLIGQHLPYYLGVNLSGRDGPGYLALKIGLIVGALAITAIAPLTGLLFVILPFALVYSALNYWMDCLDHAGLVGREDDLDASRNVLASRPVRALFFPRHDCFHLVHHLFPQVPARHLEHTHVMLESDEIYASKQNAVRKLGKGARPETTSTKDYAAAP